MSICCDLFLMVPIPPTKDRTRGRSSSNLKKMIHPSCTNVSSKIEQKEHAKQGCNFLIERQCRRSLTLLEIK